MTGPALFTRALRPHGRGRAVFKDQSGLALVEFAISLPLLLLVASAGLELANYVLTMKQVGEIATLVADNASRMGAQNVINDKPVSEAEINDVFIGASMQGRNLDIEHNGRIILSSLQQNVEGGQTIAWQRCYGALDYNSSWGEEGDGETGTDFPGMGPETARVTASSGTAVMVVEISYHYKRVMPFLFMPLKDIRESAAFNVRDTRDLTRLYNIEDVPVSNCPPPSPAS